MNGEAISEILGEMTGETVVNAKGIFEPEKIKRANQYLKDILESTNLDEYLKNMDNSEFQQLVMEHYFTVTDMQKIVDRLNSNSKNSSEKDTGWSKKGFIWGRTEIVIPKLLINKKEEIKVIKNVGTEGIALVLSDEASSRDLLISPSHFQEIFKKFLERSIKEEMSVETWKIIRKRLAELKEKAVINDEFIDQIQPTLEQIKQSIKTQNADFNNIKRIKELLNLSIITPKDIIDETPDEVIHDMLKSSSRMFKGWSDYEILQLIDKKDIKTHEYKQPPGLGPNPIKKVRTPLYMKYIMELSQNDATPIIIRKGALNGYKFILLEDMKVVILEKEKNSNATYVLPVVKALEKAQENTKKELRGTADVEVIKHTANWAENLNKAIQKVQEYTILEGQPDVTYIKDLTEERGRRINELGEAIKDYYIKARKIGE